jgi:hypothetical protein
MTAPMKPLRTYHQRWKTAFARWARERGHAIGEVIADGAWHRINNDISYRFELEGYQGPKGELGDRTNIQAVWSPSLRLPNGNVDVAEVAAVAAGRFREVPEWRFERDSHCPRYVNLALKSARAIVPAEIVAVGIPGFKGFPADWWMPSAFTLSIRILAGRSTGISTGTSFDVDVPLCRGSAFGVPPALGRLQAGGTVTLHLKKFNADTAELVAMMVDRALVEAA